jgi:ribosomal protein S18 acetylase RimI-like enzyme
MNPDAHIPQTIFSEIGITIWSSRDDAFIVQTPRGARLALSPNSEQGVPSHVHIDEIEVPEELRRKGVASDAMSALCELADRYHFSLEGGPVGWSDHPWREVFVRWLRGFGFRRNTKLDDLPLDDPAAFCVSRKPTCTRKR